MARESAAAAASILQAEFMDDAGVLNSRGKDIKTQADLSAQQQILQRLEASGIPVLAEEDVVQPRVSQNRIWLVDPLDGTFNFSRGFPMAAVSVALWEENKPLLGVIHEIFSGDVFSASVAGGAWLGGRKIQVSNVRDRSDAALATGLPVCRVRSQYSTVVKLVSV